MRPFNRTSRRSAAAAGLVPLALAAGVAVAAADGLDRSFSQDGSVAIDSGGSEFANGLALQADGKIVVAGGTTVNGGDATVYRLTKKGNLDSTFDGDGRVGINSGGDEHLHAVAVQPDGKIVVVGATSINDNVAVYRLKRNGKLDRSFDTDGALGIDSGGSEHGFAVALQRDGKILVAGSSSVG